MRCVVILISIFVIFSIYRKNAVHNEPREYISFIYSEISF